MFHGSVLIFINLIKDSTDKHDYLFKTKKPHLGEWGHRIPPEADKVSGDGIEPLTQGYSV